MGEGRATVVLADQQRILTVDVAGLVAGNGATGGILDQVVAGGIQLPEQSGPSEGACRRAGVFFRIKLQAKTYIPPPMLLAELPLKVTFVSVGCDRYCTSRRRRWRSCR